MDLFPLFFGGVEYDVSVRVAKRLNFQFSFGTFKELLGSRNVLNS